MGHLWFFCSLSMFQHHFHHLHGILHLGQDFQSNICSWMVLHMHQGQTFGERLILSAGLIGPFKHMWRTFKIQGVLLRDGVTSKLTWLKKKKGFMLVFNREDHLIIKIVDNGHCIIVEKILRWLWLLHATSSPQGVTINTQWQGPPEFFLWTSCMYCPFVQPMSLAKDKQDFRVGSPDDFNRNIRPTWKKLRQPCLGLIFPEFVSQLKTFTYHPGWFKLEILFINSGQVPSSAIDVTPLIQINVKRALLIMGQ